MPPRMSGSRRRASRCSSSSPCSSPISLPSAKEFEPRKHSLGVWTTTQYRQYSIFLSLLVSYYYCYPSTISQTQPVCRKTHQGVLFTCSSLRARRLWQAAYCLPLTSCSARGSVCSRRQNTHTHTYTQRLDKFVLIYSVLFFL